MAFAICADRFVGADPTTAGDAALPGVREAAVVGIPDPILGMAIKAVVVVDPAASLSRDDVIRHCAKHLEEFMVPKAVEFRDALPNRNGKINRRQIAAQEPGPRQ